MVRDLNTIPELNEVIEIDDSLFEVVGISEENMDKLETAPYSYWKSVLRQLLKNKMAILCVIIVLIIILFTIFGPMIHTYNGIIRVNGALEALDPFTSYYVNKKVGTVFFPFGTAYNGRDLWTMIWEGSRFSLLLAAVSSLINVAVGLVVGGLWGYVRKLDPIMIEISNVISNIPSLLIYILVIKMLPSSGDSIYNAFWNSVLIMTMFGWMGLASTMRNQIIIIRNREFNVASECLGSSPLTIITHNLLPSLVSIIAQIVVDYIPASISTEVSLIFFGALALPSGHYSLGSVLNEAFNKQNLQRALTYKPHTIIIPSAIMILITLSFFYFGLALADATDPKKHR